MGILKKYYYGTMNNFLNNIFFTLQYRIFFFFFLHTIQMVFKSCHF